jgi:hypothetical protein
MLDAFGPDLAQRVAALLRQEPALAVRLALAPARALHASGAFLQAPACAEWTLARQAEALLHMDARALLDHALPGHDPRLYRLLDRLSFPVWPFTTLKQLAELIPEDYEDLRRGVAVFPTEIVVRTEARQDDPALRRVIRAFSQVGTATPARQVMGFLRHMGIEPDWSGLPPRAGANALARRILKALTKLPLPQVDIPTVPGWCVVATVGEAQELGRKLGNCLGSSSALAHVARAMGGGGALLWNEGARVLVELRREAPGCWFVFQVSGNSAGEQAQAALEAELSARGVFLLDAPLAQLTQWLAHEKA